MDSLNSSSGSSKSGAMRILPLALSALQGHCVLGSVRASIAYTIAVLRDYHLVAGKEIFN